MSEPNQEPTMEEILASIRRIISEDEAPPESSDTTPAPVAEAAPAPEPASEPEPAPEPGPVMAALEPEPAAEDDDVLELTERIEPAESLGDIDVFPTAARAAEPEPPPPPPPPRAPALAPEEDALVSSVAAGAAASAFGQLAQSIAMPRDARSLEDVVRELLRPLLKDWLDRNLPEIVRSAVAAEVERIARSRGR